MRATILVVGEHRKYLEGLKATGLTVVVVGSESDSWQRIVSSPPDLVIIEVRKSQRDGLMLSQKLRLTPAVADIPIIMLAKGSQEEDEIAGLDAGADDYIHRPVSEGLLVSRIRAHLRRRKPVQKSSVLQRHDLIIDRDRYLVRRPGKEREQRIHLPRKEFELLNRLAMEPGRVLSREALLDAVWGRDVYVTPRTVDVHVRKIRDKLGDSYIETVKGVGYRFKE